MFIGHFAAALGAKRAAPRTSLGMAIGAAQLPDLVWPLLVLAGVERVRIAPGDTAFTPLAFEHYPWSHSLLAVVLWGLAAGLAYRAATRDDRGAIAVGLLVLSHWVLDFVVHRPDLPLYPGGGERLGLGLWNSVPATIGVELALLVAGLALYFSATEARDRVGRFGPWALALLLLVIYAGNLYGPAPASAKAVALGAMGLWLLVLLGWWVDGHRTASSRERRM